MEEITFSPRELLPNFAALQDGTFSTPEAFSSLVVALLLLVLVIFSLTAIHAFFKARSAVRFYRGLLTIAGFDDKAQTDFDRSSLPDKRRDLLNTALKKPAYGRLWREFDESLVMSPDGAILSNTLDASHFFNAHTLARGLTENRLMAAVPGFLTAIGVIGTFAGLQMGLANLNLQNSQEVAEIKAGIGAVTMGAAIAFMTSVWGVGTSVLFNLFEKILERNVRSAIARLQRHVDYLYPRIIAEQSLVRIADFNQRSHDSLQCLAEKIGDQMQEAMTQATSSMSREFQDALNKILAPAIDSLVNNASRTSESVIKDVVANFSERLGEAGEQQRSLMEEATGQINMATSNLAQQLSQFSESATTQKDEMAETFEGLLGQVVAKFETLNQAASMREQERHDGAQKEFELMHQANQQAVSALLAGVKGQLAEMGEREQQRSDAMTQRIGALGTTQDELIQSVEQLINNQKMVHNDILKQMQSIQARYDESIGAQQSSSEAIYNAATQMQGVAKQIEQLGTALHQSSTTLGESIESAAVQIKGVTNQNEKTSQTLKQLGEGYTGISQTMEAVVEKLNVATKHAQSGFEAVDANLDKFRQQLDEQVNEMANQLDALMRDFAKHVEVTSEKRMNQWNQQTGDYTSSMTNAIQALSGVVDELERKQGIIN